MRVKPTRLLADYPHTTNEFLVGPSSLLVTMVMILMRIRLAKLPLHVFRVALLLVALYDPSESANAQSHNVDGSFLIDTRIDGTPAVLLFDTGAEHSLLDREYARQLGLRPVGVANILTPYSSSETEVVVVADLDIQSIHSSGVKMMTEDLATSFGALGVHIDGVLGNDFLRQVTATLDYSAGTVTFARKPVTHHGIPIKLHRVGDRYFALLNFAGVPLSFLVDTGTNFSSLSQSGWSRLDQSRTTLRFIDGVRSSGTSATSKLVCISRVIIGQTSYQNLAMRVQPPLSDGFLASPGIDGLLGSDFLKQFVVVFDLGNSSLYLNVDHNFKVDPNRFSTIGIQFAKNPRGFFTVMAVWSPSPASIAKINVGDEIVSVNGRSTLDMNQDDLSREIHGEPGRKVLVRIGSGGDQRTVSLAMRNLLCQSPPGVTR